MENILNDINDYPLKLCNGKLLKTNMESQCAYNWAIPMKCNACEITRYVCKICIQSPNSIRMGHKELIVRSKMWRHNLRHLKRDDLESKLDNMDNNDFNKGKQKKCEVICVESSENESTTLEGNLDESSPVQTIDFDGKAQDGNLDLEPATDMKHSEDIHNIYDNEHSYEYYRNNASINVEDSGPAFMVGKLLWVP